MPTVRIKDIVMVPISKLVPYPRNPNKHTPEQIERLAQIIEFQGWRYPIKVSNQSGFITSGHGRLEAAKIRGWGEVPVSYQDYDNEAMAYADVVSDNAIAEWSYLDLSSINSDIADLGPDFDIDLLGIKDFTLDVAEKYSDESNLMRDTFIEPPFSVLNARREAWQNRKRWWISLGIQSELGRGGGRNDSQLQEPGTTLGATPPNQNDLYKRLRK